MVHTTFAKRNMLRVETIAISIQLKKKNVLHRLHGVRVDYESSLGSIYTPIDESRILC
jgi:hypothetical protein